MKVLACLFINFIIVILYIAFIGYTNAALIIAIVNVLIVDYIILKT